MADWKDIGIVERDKLIAAHEAEIARLRELVERAQQCVPPGYVNWHFAARAALEPRP